MIYQLCPPDVRGNVCCVKRIEPDAAFVFVNETSADYQAYLKWLAEGNTPLPADE